MSFGEWSRRIVHTPAKAFERVRLLMPGSVWEGVCLGAVALVAAGAALLFHGLTDWIQDHTIERLMHVETGWFVVGTLVSVLMGSFLACWLIAHFAPRAAGGGVLPVKMAFWKEFGVMKPGEAAVKLVASALTLGSGVSLGPEGPSVQIGAATMSAAAGAAGVAKSARRAWCAAGGAAGLAAVFNAPLAAITFMLEEVIGDLNSRLLGKVVIAAVVGAMIGHAVLGPQPAFQTSPLGVISWRPWVLLPFVAVLAAVGGAWFQKWSLALRARLLLRPKGKFTAYRPMIGALITWGAGVSVFLATGHAGIFGIGYHDITAAIAGDLALTTALFLFLGKIVATAGAVGSGGCGGIFAPSLFIGAMAGVVVGRLGMLVLPLQSGELAMLVMTGMAASLGAVIRAPLTCVLLLFEVTNQWVIVPALMITTLVSQAVARRVTERDMYDEMLEQNGVDPHQVLPPRNFKRWREMPVGALATFQPATLDSLAMDDLRAAQTTNPHTRYPVLDADGAVIGVLPFYEMEQAIRTGNAPRLEEARWIAPTAEIGDAKKIILGSGTDFLCVGEAGARRLLGVLTLRDILRGESVLEDDAES